MDGFLKNETDLVFTLKEYTRQMPGIVVHRDSFILENYGIVYFK